MLEPGGVRINDLQRCLSTSTSLHHDDFLSQCFQEFSLLFFSATQLHSLGKNKYSMSIFFIISLYRYEEIPNGHDQCSLLSTSIMVFLQFLLQYNRTDQFIYFFSYGSLFNLEKNTRFSISLYLKHILQMKKIVLNSKQSMTGY